MDFSGCRDDDSFGPAVQGCRGNFDFTIKFEQIFLALLPPAVFVAVALPRLAYIWQRPVIISGALLRTAKIACIAALAGLNLGLLIVSASQPGKFKAFFSASSALGLLASLFVSVLSFLEHARSARPSILLTGYLALDILFSIVQTRTFWLARSASLEEAVLVVAGYHLNSAETVFCRLYSAALACKVLVLLLESVHKGSFMRGDVGWDAKQHSPEETSGLFGLGGFLWLNPLFWIGFRKILTIEDLFALDQTLATDLLQARLAQHALANGGKDAESGGGYDFGHKKYGLLKALVKALAVPLLLPIGPRIALTGFLFGQPFIINAALEYLEEPEGSVARNNSYGLIGATVLIYLGTAASTAMYYYFQERAMFMVRGALAGAVYRKTTEIPLNAADDAAAITLMSTDVERIRVGFLQINEYWANIIQMALASFLLHRQLGTAFVAPLAVIVVCVLLIGVLSMFTGKRQKAWMALIQKRVGMTSNTIAHMKHLKISGLAAPIENLVQQLRIDELSVGSRFRLILCFSAAIAYTPNMLSPVFTFVMAANSLDTAGIFTSLSFVVLVTMPFVGILQGMPQLISAFACLDRVQAFLEKEPRRDFREPLHSLDKPPLPEDSTGSDRLGNASLTTVAMSNGNYGWEADKYNLRDIDLDIPTAKLTIVVGPVASGKSTLCKALLGETTEHAGHLRVDLLAADGRFRRIGYCDQVPYLSNATVRDNVIGMTSEHAVFDVGRYNEAIEAAMLLPDLALLPQGDLTKVGSKGITLSGGQKQRVSVARALYARTDLYIFDDILSGLDADTEEQVFKRVFGPDGLLRRQGATTILCTHSVRHLPAADHVVALGVDGKIVEQGTFEHLLANRKYVHSLGVKATDSSADASNNTSQVSSDVDEASDKENDAIICSAGTAAALAADKEAAIDTSVNEASRTSVLPAATPEFAYDNEAEELTDAQKTSRALGDSSVYMHYFRSLGVLPLVLFSVFGMLFGFLFAWGTIWLKFWAEDKAKLFPTHSNAFYLGLYGLFQATGILSLFIVCLVAFNVMIRLSGAKLHRDAIRTVVRAPLRFFTKTDNGVVTNYFSQDMTLIDGELPNALTNVGVGGFEVLCAAGVIATASPYLAITYPFLLIILYGIQKFYLRTSRQLRLLDLEAKSPLYTHFLDTMAGLATFRAFGWVAAGIALNNKLINRSQRPAYFLAMIQRWLNFTLQCVVAVLAIVVVALATQLQSNTAFTGASLISLMSFGDMVSYIMFSYTQLETSIGAVSRLKTFSETVHSESHNDGDDQVVPAPSWPKEGRIQLTNVSATYDDVTKLPAGKTEPHLVLNKLSLVFRAGEKVAICGRTGSGKSSFILLLLRLLNPYTPDNSSKQETSDPEGSNVILIDDLPLNKVDRAALRERIIAVPQDAVFLPDGTSFQRNLDPFDMADAAMCRSVLEIVELWPFVEDRGGLDAGLVVDTLSQGQKQLFSLARAILRKRVRAVRDGASSGVLLLDEVSSSVDKDTDRAMQTVIRDEFAGYTVIMVSHRLDIVMAACDTVVVLDRGAVVEKGQPTVLAATEGTRFRELWLVGNNE